MMTARTKDNTTDPVYNFVFPQRSYRENFSDYMYRLRNGIKDKEMTNAGVKARDDAFLLGMNPDQQVVHYQQDKELFWQQWSDAKTFDIQMLQGFVYLFMQRQNSDIFKTFPVKQSFKGRIEGNEMIFTTSMPTMGVRKVPGRHINVTYRRRQGDMVYTGQGISIALETFNTPEGMQMFDNGLNAVISDIYFMIIHSGYNEFMSIVSVYRGIDARYPVTDVPRTINQLYEAEALWFLALNKQPQAITLIFSQVEKIFQLNKQDTVRQIWTTKNTVDFINGKDESNTNYSYAGPSAVENRKGHAQIKNIPNVEVMTIQHLDPALHGVHDYVLTHTVQTGSMFDFPDMTIFKPAHLYTASDRDIKFCSIEHKDPKLYRLNDALRHSPLFVPLNSTRHSVVEQGGLNRALLWDMGEKIDELSALVKTDLRGHEERAHQFLSYHSVVNNLPKTKQNKSNGYDSDDSDESLNNYDETDRRARDGKTRSGYNPIYCIGEIDECKLKDSYLDAVCHSFKHAMMKHVTEEQINSIQDGVRLCEFLSKNVDKFASIIAHFKVAYIRSDASRSIETEGDINENQDAATSLGINMFRPNEFGFVDIDPDELAKASHDFVPYGCGTIPGMLTLYEFITKNPRANIRDDIKKTILKFIPAYKALIKVLLSLTVENPIFDPTLVPLYNNSGSMTDFTRIMIVAYTFLFDRFQEPFIYETSQKTNITLIDIPNDQKNAIITQKLRDGLASKTVAVEDILKVLDDITKTKNYEFAEKNLDMEQLFMSMTNRSYNILIDRMGDLTKAYAAKKTGQGDSDHITALQDRIVNTIKGLVNNNSFTSQDAVKVAAFINAANKYLVTLWTYSDKVDPSRKKISDHIAALRNTLSNTNWLQTNNTATQQTNDSVVLTPFYFSTFKSGVWIHKLIMEKFAYTTVTDTQNTFTYSRTVIVPIPSSPPPTYNKTSLHDPFGGNTLGSTVLTALFFVDPRLPWQTTTIENVEREGEYSDVFPSPGHYRMYNDKSSIIGHEMYHQQLYRREGFELAQSNFPHLSEFVHHTINCPLQGHDRNTLTTIDARFKRTAKADLVTKIASRCVIMQKITTKVFDLWTLKNIKLPFGVKLLRPFEDTEAESMIFLAAGVVGNTYFSGLDNTVSFDASLQHYSVQVFGHFRVWIRDTLKVFVAPCIRGIRPAGGEGDEYFNVDERGQIIAPTNEEAWSMLMGFFGEGDKMRRYSILVSVTCANNAIESPLRELHVDARGYHPSDDYIGRMPMQCDEFNGGGDELMYDDALLFAYLYKFHNRTVVAPEFDRLTHHEDMRRRRYNNVCHRNTQWYRHPMSGEWVEVQSAHPAGRHEYDTFGKKSSINTVRVLTDK